MVYIPEFVLRIHTNEMRKLPVGDLCTWVSFDTTRGKIICRQTYYLNIEESRVAGIVVHCLPHRHPCWICFELSGNTLNESNGKQLK